MITEVPGSKAVIVLVHGMQEYSDRYKKFCDYLNQHGYSTIRYDLLGHGKKLPLHLHGYFGRHGWQNLINQLHEQVQLAHSRFKNQQVILFGHSMGTIIIRSYLQHYHDFDGVILSGVPYYNPLWRVGKLLSKTLSAVKGAKNTSPLLTKLTTGGFNQKIDHPHTDFDWLSHNVKDVRAYIKDKYCGIPFTNAGYSALYDGMKELGRLRQFHSKHAVPLLFLNGQDDPCAGNEQQRQTSLNTLKHAGYRNITAKTYQHMRHEILFEEEAHLVQEDIVDWLKKHFA